MKIQSFSSLNFICFQPRPVVSAWLLLLTVSGVARSQVVIGNTLDSTPQLGTAGNETHSLSFNNNGEFLLVGISAVHALNGSNGSVDATITYNGVSMVQYIDAVKSNDEYSAIFYLANPATGSNTLSVDFGDKLDDSDGAWQFGAVSLSNVNEADPFASSFPPDGLHTTSNINLVSDTPGEINSGDLVFGAIGHDYYISGAPAYTLATGAPTQLYNDLFSGVSNNRANSSMYQLVTAGDLSGTNGDEVFMTRDSGNLKAVSFVVVNQIPEPSSLALVSIMGLVYMVSRRRKG